MQALRPASHRWFFWSKPAGAQAATAQLHARLLLFMPLLARLKVGAALAELLAEGVVRRDQLFITGKLWNSSHAAKDVKPALMQTLSDLGVSAALELSPQTQLTVLARPLTCVPQALSTTLPANILEQPALTKRMPPLPTTCMQWCTEHSNHGCTRRRQYLCHQSSCWPLHVLRCLT